MSTEHLMADRWIRQRDALTHMAYGMNRDTLDVVTAILVAAQFIGDSIPDAPLDVRLTDGWPR